MKNKNVLVTGSSGLVGSEAVKYFIDKGFIVHGIDNDLRKYFFGSGASTVWNRRYLEKTFENRYIHHTIDIRDAKSISDIFTSVRFSLIIHAAAQPSHDWSMKEPMMDFGVNATGTLQLLELYRKYSPDAVFIFTSTNKVYGSNPNTLSFVEEKTRFELPKHHQYYRGINESMSIDNTLHTVFGVSKISADLMVQEYGKYFGLPTVVFRCGCLTGPHHSSSKMHGFLAYLVRSIHNRVPYTIFGYKGKQVRDNIHAYDLVDAFHQFYLKPRSGEVYNMGGSRHSHISVLEAISRIEFLLGKKANYIYDDRNRIGDHIWYISDVTKFKTHYPAWEYSYSMDRILEDICKNGHF